MFRYECKGIVVTKDLVAGTLKEFTHKQDPFEITLVYQGDSDDNFYLIIDRVSKRDTNNPFKIKLTITVNNGENKDKTTTDYINPQYECALGFSRDDLEKNQVESFEYSVKMEEFELDELNDKPPTLKIYNFSFNITDEQDEYKQDFTYATYNLTFYLTRNNLGRYTISFSLNDDKFENILEIPFKIKIHNVREKGTMKFSSKSFKNEFNHLSSTQLEKLYSDPVMQKLDITLTIKSSKESQEYDYDTDFYQTPTYPSSSYAYNGYQMIESSSQSSQTTYSTTHLSSKEETGYVGLQNQGATCYMNSLLQTLYTLPAFRKVVYEMPTTGTEDEKKSIPLNLQRLFCSMQLGKDACSTKELTTSFGWGSTETFMQHDAPEFNRVLLDKLEMKLKGTQLENSIADLFKGQYRKYIRCKNYPYSSTHDETFYELQMVVKDCPDLQKSFEKYTEKEILDGDNQYKVEGHGFEDAEMGIEFIKFPTVLQLHLSRFQYDFNYDRNVKLNDKFEFPEEIDLAPYLAEDQDKSKPLVYQLHDVVVHHGSASFGHYYAFIRPSAEDQWYKFNDSTVSKSSKESAIDDNFGGETDTSSSYSYNAYSYWGGSSGKAYSAYMLVYIRKDAVANIYEPIPDEAVPEHLKEYMNNKKSTYEDTSLSRLTCEVTLTTEDEFADNTLKMKKIFAPVDNPSKITFERENKGEDLYEQVAKELKVDIDEIRLWKQNAYALTPTTLIEKNEKKVDFVYYTEEVFVQKKAKEDPIEIKEDDIVVYCKFFFPNFDGCKVQYIGSIPIEKTASLKSLVALVCDKMGFPEGTDLQSYMESIDKKAAILDPALHLDSLNVNMGSVIIFQLPPEAEQIEPTKFTKKNVETVEAKNEKEGELLSLPVTFAGDQTSAVTVNKYFIMYNEVLEYYLFDIHDTAKALAILRFPTDIPFTDLFVHIAKAANVEFDPLTSCMLIYKSSSTDDEKPNTDPIDINYFVTPKTILFAGTNKRLYFRIIKGTPQSEIQSSICRRIIYCKDMVHADVDDVYLFPKTTDTVGKVIEECINRKILPEGEYECIKIGYYSAMEGFQSMDSSCSQYTNTTIRIHPKLEDKSKLIFAEVGEFTTSMYYFTPSRPGIGYIVDDAKTSEEIKADIFKLFGFAEDVKLRMYYKGKDDTQAKPVTPSDNLKDIIKDQAMLYIIEKAKKPSRSTSYSESIKIYN